MPITKQQISTTKAQLWNYLQHLHMRWEEVRPHLSGRWRCGILDEVTLTKLEIEYWKVVEKHQQPKS